MAPAWQFLCRLCVPRWRVGVPGRGHLFLEIDAMTADAQLWIVESDGKWYARIIVRGVGISQVCAYTEEEARQSALEDARRIAAALDGLGEG